LYQAAIEKKARHQQQKKLQKIVKHMETEQHIVEWKVVIEERKGAIQKLLESKKQDLPEPMGTAKAVLRSKVYNYEGLP
jgi:hypothetical protein